ncbi:DUF6040 family protein [Blautia wexlerae]|uniref:DUF6040 family protein n=1 Tax=Blautia wexlerae TaxID=418240 RepID=UPI003B50335A
MQELLQMRSLQFFKMPDIWDCMADWMLMILNLYYRMFQIKSVIPVNIITLLLLVHVIYIGIRCYVKDWMEERGYF